MSTEEYAEMYPHLRNIFEQHHGKYELGKPTDDGFVYVGIHIDERDGKWKEWFTTDGPMEMPNGKAIIPLAVSFSDAIKWVERLPGAKWELPASHIIEFMRHATPKIISPRSFDVDYTSSDRNKSYEGPKTVIDFNNIVLYNRVPYLIRDCCQNDRQIGLIQPVFSQPLSQN